MPRTLLLRAPGALVALLAAAPLTAAAQTPGPGLSLEAAVAAAREHNPELQAQRTDAISAEAATRAARADFLPSASASAGFGYTAPGVQRFGSEVFGTRPDYYSSNYQLGLSYSLSGAKLMQPGIARAQETAVDLRIAGAESGLVAQVTQQYLLALQARERIAQSEREVERAQEHERYAEARLQVGAGTPLDLRRAQVQRGQAEVQLVQNRNAYRSELLRLGQLMGRDVPHDEPLTSTFTIAEPAWNADALVEEATERNPTIQAARASSGAAGAQVRAARSAYLPTMSFGLNLNGSVYSAGNLDPLVESQLDGLRISHASCLDMNQIRESAGLAPNNCGLVDPTDPVVQARVRDQIAADNPTFPFGYQRQPVTASVTFSLPLFDGLGRERRVAEARASATRAEMQVRGEERRVATEVRQAVLDLQTAHRMVELQGQVAESAADELRLAEERFRFGAASSVEVTDAQTSLAEAERGRIDAVYAYHRTLAGLEALVGRTLRQP